MSEGEAEVVELIYLDALVVLCGYRDDGTVTIWECPIVVCYVGVPEGVDGVHHILCAGEHHIYCYVEGLQLLVIQDFSWAC